MCIITTHINYNAFSKSFHKQFTQISQGQYLVFIYEGYYILNKAKGGENDDRQQTVDIGMCNKSI